MQRPARFSLLQGGNRRICFQFPGKLLCKGLGLLFVQKPVVTDWPFESQDSPVHAHLPGNTSLGHLAEFDDKTIADRCTHGY